MDDCIFCKIISGEIPCAKIYEDDDVLAFLDISQTTKGHALVVSKKHYDNFLATPKEIMHKVMDVAQTIGQSQIRNLKASGVNILTNCYAAAGQSVIRLRGQRIRELDPHRRLFHAAIRTGKNRIHLYRGRYPG